MLAVLVEMDLHVPTARSLKDKRGVIRRIQSRLRTDLRVSVAEVGHQDLWQRSLLGIAIAAGDAVTGGRVAQQVERLVAGHPDVEILQVHTQLVGTEP